MKAWLLWFLMCAVVLLAVFLIALGIAIHSSRFGVASVEMALLLALGVETLATFCFVTDSWYKEATK